MHVVIDCAAGLDVHQASIVACVLGGPGAGARRTKRIRTFATTNAELEALADWLVAEGVSHAGMEATGVYWHPVFAVLEARGTITPIVANARHIKAVPGRKTDVRDAEWIADLVRHGLVRASFVPDKATRERRDLSRYRRTLVEAQSSERQRLIKALDSAGVKLAGVLSDVFGVSGRAILRALIEGRSTPREMAKLARGTAKAKHAALVEALDVGLDDHHRLVLGMQLDRVERAEADIATLDAELDRRLAPHAQVMAELVKIPGLERVVALTVLCEIGPDVSMFATFRHLCAWAGVCPSNRQSAGKAKPARARQGNPYLKTALCNAAISAARKKGSYYKAKYHKLKTRIGGGKAALAIAHKLLIAIYKVLRGETFRDLGEDHLDKNNDKRRAIRLVRQLEKVGYSVILMPIPKTAT